MLVIAQNKRVILIQTGLVGGGWWGWGDKSEGISFWKPKVLCSGPICGKHKSLLAHLAFHTLRLAWGSQLELLFDSISQASQLRKHLSWKCCFTQSEGSGQGDSWEEGPLVVILGTIPASCLGNSKTWARDF